MIPNRKRQLELPFSPANLRSASELIQPYAVHPGFICFYDPGYIDGMYLVPVVFVFEADRARYAGGAKNAEHWYWNIQVHEISSFLIERMFDEGIISDRVVWWKWEKLAVIIRQKNKTIEILSS